MSKSMQTQDSKPHDPAHAPGHRRLSVDPGGDPRHASSNSPQNSSALNRMAKADVIARNEKALRREIPGSSINAKGRDIGRVPMGGRGK